MRKQYNQASQCETYPSLIQYGSPNGLLLITNLTKTRTALVRGEVGRLLGRRVPVGGLFRCRWSELFSGRGSRESVHIENTGCQACRGSIEVETGMKKGELKAVLYRVPLRSVFVSVIFSHIITCLPHPISKRGYKVHVTHVCNNKFVD